jgi:dihydropyrimidinase
MENKDSGGVGGALYIRNALLATPSGTTEADIVAKDGVIVSIGECRGRPERRDAENVLDAGGRLLLPGGIDPHVHMAMRAGATMTSDDFSSGSLAALRGGTIALVDFVEPDPGEGLVLALEKRRAESETSKVPVKLHVTISEWRGETPDEMRRCVDRGVKSFKIYLAYLDTIGIDDRTAYKVLEAARELEAKVLVHAEDGTDILTRQAELRIQGKSSARFHALSRPPEAEAKAVAKLIGFVDELGGPDVVVAHVSSELAMREIKRAKERGLRVFAETCPHYLAFTEDEYDAAMNRGALYAMSPPLRRRSDVEFLWSCVADGSIDFVSTDHCPFDSRYKLESAADFTRIPNGVGGVAERVAFMLTEGHIRRKIPVGRIADLVARKAADCYGFSPDRGSIGLGTRADFSVWDLDSSYGYKAGMGGSKCDYSIYEGMEFRASPAAVVVNGRIVAEDWKYLSL